MFLPTYPPDRNPIKHIWATLKKRLQNGLLDAEDKEAFTSSTKTGWSYADNAPISHLITIKNVAA